MSVRGDFAPRRSGFGLARKRGSARGAMPPADRKGTGPGHGGLNPRLSVS